jgi:integrase
MDDSSVLQMARISDADTAREIPSVKSSKDSTARKLSVMPVQKVKREKRARVRGQGSLFQRGPMYWMELHWKGERFRKSLETTDRQTALMKLDSEVNSIRSGEQPKTFQPVTVQAMFDAWMLQVETNNKLRTIEDYKSRWNAHLKAAFGGLFATQVTLDKVTEYLNRRMKEGAGVCTRNRENRVLQMIFNHNSEKIPADRMPKFPKMQSERNLVRKGRLSSDDYAKLQAKLIDPKEFWLKAILTLTFKYGFRKGELLNAKVGYFNAKEATFTLPAFTTKNKTERVVDIVSNGEIHKMLVALTEGRRPQDALFTRNGKPVKDYRGIWEKLTEGMSGGSGKGGCITIHDLRRSAITAMSERGVTAAQAGTHLTSDLFNRYISRNKAEKQATAAVIES